MFIKLNSTLLVRAESIQSVNRVVDTVYVQIEGKDGKVRQVGETLSSEAEAVTYFDELEEKLASLSPTLVTGILDETRTDGTTADDKGLSTMSKQQAASVKQSK